ncbi:MAG: Lrp/AsnC family transcriptional regulator [Candidatus Diapherotrites archaeon]|nr:Lrp/AsnC family transcriptional regulator [Candidatus Diapherotrites archaeon]
MEIDEIDARILELLSENSRMSYSDIARHFGFSDVAIRKRVDKLTEKGIIKKFTTAVDQKKLGKNVTAFLFFNTRSDKTQEIADQLLALDGIEDVYIALGVYDIIAKVHCADVVALKLLTEQKLNDINGIIEVRPSIVFTEVSKNEPA